MTFKHKNVNEMSLIICAFLSPRAFKLRASDCSLCISVHCAQMLSHLLTSHLAPLYQMNPPHISLAHQTTLRATRRNERLMMV
jgi:hypothetical protein